MADSTTALLQLVLQETGNNNNSWGDVLNAQLQKIEQAISGISQIVVGGGTKVLTDDEARPATLYISGNLLSDSIIQVPSRNKTWQVVDLTTGAFKVTLKTAGGTGYVLTRGQMDTLWCDGTNIRIPGDPNALVPVGAMLMIPWAGVPANYLHCNGAAVSRTTYAKLFAIYSTTWGAGDGSSTFNLPNTLDRYPRGANSHAVGTLLAQDIQSHTHTAWTDSQGWHGHSGGTYGAGDHTHTYQGATNTGLSHYLAAGNGAQTWAQTTSSAGHHAHSFDTNGAGTHAHNVGVAATGGTETRPNSFVINFCVRYQ